MESQIGPLGGLPLHDNSTDSASCGCDRNVHAGRRRGGTGSGLQTVRHRTFDFSKERKFDKNCLAAPANKPFTIKFDNQDPDVPHNVAIFDRSEGKKPLFKGELIIGPRTTTYSVPAQKPGRYEFVCEPHDFTMIGMFVVGDGKSR